MSLKLIVFIQSFFYYILSRRFERMKNSKYSVGKYYFLHSKLISQLYESIQMLVN
jgi:hypothetical protein